MADWIEVDDMLVDAEALASLGHLCRPALCRSSPSCCARYEITVSRREVARIVGCMPAAAELAPHLRDAGELVSVFEPVGEGLLAIDTDEAGRCAFAYHHPRGGTRCSLHAGAMKMGLDPYRTKPFCCSLWPLGLSEGTPPILTVTDDALRLPCNSRRAATPRRPLHEGVRQILGACFGRRTADRIAEAIASRLAGGETT